MLTLGKLDEAWDAVRRHAGRCVGRCGGDQAPVVVFRYHTTQGPVVAPLCKADAEDWQKRFGHTAAGQTLSITYVGPTTGD